MRKRYWVLAALTAALGVHVSYWGLPYQPQFELLRFDPSKATWYLRGPSTGLADANRRGPKALWQARDTDGDGMIDTLEPPDGNPIRLPRPRRGLFSSTPGELEAGSRLLILCVDGVPYQEMAKFYEEGHFREMSRPIRTISVFPSESESALTAAFHAAPVPGYEHRYFNWKTNATEGGMWRTLTGKGVPYLKVLDYDQAGIFKGLAYVVSRKTFRADIERMLQRFLGSRAPVYLAHIASTDSLYHVLTAEEMRALLLELEAVLRDLYFSSRGKTRILFFSDHGNTLALSQPVPLKSFLAARGYRLTDSLRRDRDVAVPSYGLVGFAAVYCQETQVARLAEELVHLPGADLVIHGRGDSVTVLNRQGMAQLDWSADGERFRYRALTADPIALLPALEKLGRHITVGSPAPEGWVRREDLLRVTADSRYPDAPARLRGWAINHVVHRASIMVSLADGYYYGSGLFQRIVTLRSTHGSLTATSSTGFAMTTDGTLPDPSPVEEVVPLSPTRRKQFAK